MTEDDFRRAIDANPTDHSLLLLLADWFEEQGDRRCQGLRTLVAIMSQPDWDGYVRRHWMWFCRLPEWDDPKGPVTPRSVVAMGYEFRGQRRHHLSMHFRPYEAYVEAALELLEPPRANPITGDVPSPIDP
jgi:uncharacterized protein (TIGR02996 family)